LRKLIVPRFRQRETVGVIIEAHIAPQPRAEVGAQRRPLAAGTLAAYSVPSAVSGIPGIPIPTDPAGRSAHRLADQRLTAWRKSS
jgi:hypothetical protein